MQYTAQQLLSKAKKFNIKVRKGYEAATCLAIKRAKSIPDCFGILYQEDKICKKCSVIRYCEYVTRIKRPNGNRLVEDDLDVLQPTDFKDGSRSSKFIRRWGRKFLSSYELIDLSKNMFKETYVKINGKYIDKGTIIDISRIFSILRKRGLLIQKGKLYGIKQ